MKNLSLTTPSILAHMVMVMIEDMLVHLVHLVRLVILQLLSTMVSLEMQSLQHNPLLMQTTGHSQKQMSDKWRFIFKTSGLSMTSLS